MKFSILALVYSSSIAAAQIWGGFGPGDVACASSCLSSFYPTATSVWSSHCATPPALNSCLSSACTGSTSTFSTFSSVQSSLCSVYSSCSNNPASCSTRVRLKPVDEEDGGGPGANGYFTVTVTTGGATGLTTQTTMATRTAAGSGRSVQTITTTTTQNATIVAANAQITNGAKTTSISHNAGATVGLGHNAGAIVVAAVGVMVMQFECGEVPD